TAAGIIATRNTSDEGLSLQLGKQFSIQPKALYIAAGILTLFAFVPNFPMLPFLAVGSFCAFAAFRIERNRERAKELAKIIPVEEEAKAPGDELESLLGLELIELEVGYGLVNI